MPDSSTKLVFACTFLPILRIGICLYNQVIAAAQAGKHNDKRESYGDTLIIDPWGTVVGRLPGESCFFCII